VKKWMMLAVSMLLVVQTAYHVLSVFTDIRARQTLSDITFESMPWKVKQMNIKICPDSSPLLSLINVRNFCSIACSCRAIDLIIYTFHACSCRRLRTFSTAREGCYCLCNVNLLFSCRAYARYSV
jgi:hypothetical protein